MWAWPWSWPTSSTPARSTSTNRPSPMRPMCPWRDEGLGQRVPLRRGRGQYRSLHRNPMGDDALVHRRLPVLTRHFHSTGRRPVTDSSETPMSSTVPAPAATAADQVGRWPAVLWRLAVALEGFDLVVLGAVIPELLATQALGFTPEAATLVATLSLVGVGLGAVAVGPVVDRIGRRWTIIACVIGFSLFTLFVAFAPNVALFTLFRFIAGLFLGAVMPSCLAYIGEYSNSGKTGKATTLTMTGYHAGAVAISLLAVAYSHNWHLLFAAGGLAGLLMVPLLW